MTFRVGATGRLCPGLMVAVIVSCSSEEPPARPPPAARAATPKPVDSGGRVAPAGPNSVAGVDASASTRPSGSSKEAREIFESMLKVYAECETYADKGTIKNTLALNRGFFRDIDLEQHFYTNYKRPDEFRFAQFSRVPFTKEWTHSVVWGRGDEISSSGDDFTWLMEEMLERIGRTEDGDAETDGGAAEDEGSEGSDDGGLASPTGSPTNQDTSTQPGDAARPSEDGNAAAEDAAAAGSEGGEGDDLDGMGALAGGGFGTREREPTWQSIGLVASMASEIPALILGDKSNLPGPGLDSLEDLRLEPDESVGGEPCFKIVGDLPQDLAQKLPDMPFMSLSKRMKVFAKFTLWIEKERRVIRKLQLAAGVMNMGRLNIPGQGSFRIPDMDFGYEKIFEPRLNEEMKWHELVFDVPGAAGGATHGTASWRNDEFEPTELSEPAARKAAEEIMADMAKVYSTCKSYQDRGVIEVTAVDRNAARDRRLPFETAFVRPDGFRFEYREETRDAVWTRHIICREGDRIRVWCHEQSGIHDRDSMHLAIQELGFHCKTPMDAIPGLLMPKEIGNTYLGRPTDMVLLGSQEVDGKACYKVRGTDPFGWSMTLWIEQERKLLRRIQAKFHGHDVPVWVTATFETRINKKVAKKYLTLGSPKSAGGTGS